MSETSGQYEDLLTKLNQLKRNLSVIQNSVNQNELNNDFNKIIKNSESEVNNIKHSINRLKTVSNQFNQRMSQLSPLLTSISPLLDKFEDLTKLDQLLDRLETIRRIHYSLDSNVNNCRNAKEFESRVVSITQSFNQLIAEYKLFRDVYKSELIVKYLFEIIMFWKNILYEKFEPKFIETFESINWPNISSDQKFDHKLQSNNDSINTFILYFNAVFTIDIETKLSLKSDNKNRKPEVIVLPMDLMLRPIKKRFQYHFMETKSKLNRPEKVF